MGSQRFTGKIKGSTIRLPEDMWEYLRLRAAQEDRTLSRVVRRALEKDIFDCAENTPKGYTEADMVAATKRLDQYKAARAKYTTEGDE